MKITIASTLIAFASLLGFASPAMAAPACYEDMACWEPTTMGNHEGTLPNGEVSIPGDYSIAD